MTRFMLIARVGLVLIVGILVEGCTTSGKIYTSEQRYPAKPKDAAVEVVNLADEKRAYEILAIVGAGGLSVPVDPLPYLKREARKIGADAISIPELKARDGGAHVESKAIRWK